MSTTALLVLLGLLIVGVALIALGRRGRRLNDHPQCRWCGFDLAGVYPASPTCPECGAGLKRDGAVRNGVRRRSIPVMVLGVLLAAAPLLPIAVIVYATLTGTNISKYLPTGALMFEARFASPAASAAIADELIDRSVKKRLDKGQETKIAALILRLQSDRTAPWDEKWGDLFQRIVGNGNATADQERDFGQNAAALTLKARPKVRAGDPLPLRVMLGDERLGAADTYQTEVCVVSVKLNDQELRAKTTMSFSFNAALGEYPDADAYLETGTGGWTQVSGSKANSGWRGNDQRTVISRTVPKGFTPGPATAAVTVAVRAIPQSNNMSWTGRADKDPHARRVTLTVPVTIVPADQETVELVEPTPELEASMRKALYGLPGEAVTSSIDDHQRWANGVVTQEPHFNVMYLLPIHKDLPVPVSFDVLVRADGEEHLLGSIVSGDGIQSWVSTDSQQSASRSYTGGSLYAIPANRQVDLIYRPRPKTARHTTDLTKVYNGEIEVKDIPLHIQDNRQNKTVPIDKLTFKKPRPWNGQDE